MHLLNRIERGLRRVALVFTICAWLGLVYTAFHGPYPDLGFITIATLACSVIGMLCGISTFEGEDWRSVRTWMQLLFYTVPVLGMLLLVDRSGIYTMVF